MELYIGGISQGKLRYVANKKRIAADSIMICDGAVCSKEDILSKPIINHFHDYIKRLLSEEVKVEEFLEELLRKNPGAVIISNEVGYGIVPMDKSDRIFRETVGRSLCRLAENADKVERIVCGIGMKIK